MKKRLYVILSTFLSLLLLFLAAPVATAEETAADAPTPADAAAQLTALLQNASCAVPMEIANTEADIIWWLDTVWLPGLSDGMLLALELSGEAALYAEPAEEDGFTPAVAGDPSQPAGTDGTLPVRFYYYDAQARQVTLPVEKSCLVLASPFSEYEIVLPEEACVYSGAPVTPAVTVMRDDVPIPADAFTVTYENNVNAGLAAVIAAIEQDGEEAEEIRSYFYIERALLEVIPNNRSMRVGGKLPTLTYKTVGFLGGDTFLAEPALTTDANIGLAGEYGITVQGGYAGPNYVTELYNGVLTVQKASAGRPTVGGASLVPKVTKADADETKGTELDDLPFVRPLEGGWRLFRAQDFSTGTKISDAMRAEITGAYQDPATNVVFVAPSGESGSWSDIPGDLFKDFKKELDGVHFATEDAILSFPGGNDESDSAASFDALIQDKSFSVSLERESAGGIAVTLLIDGKEEAMEPDSPVAFLTMAEDAADMHEGYVIMKENAAGTPEPIVESVANQTLGLVSAPIQNGGRYYLQDNSRSFPDLVDRNSAADFLSARGIMNGMDTGEFSSQAPATFAQLVTVLRRLADAPETTRPSSSYGAMWYADAVAWAMETNIILPDNKGVAVDPDATITKGEFTYALRQFHQKFIPADTNGSALQFDSTGAERPMLRSDIAEEMMAYTKNNILVQSAQAMLAQANMVPQGVLQLLQ